ncbi:Glutamine-binding periplasmic protein precursor [compost metagenome]
MRRGWLVAILGIFLAAAPSAGAASKPLVIGTEPNFPPLSYLDGGRIAGFEIDLIQELAKGMGTTVHLQSVSFGDQPKLLGSGKLDAAISSWTITPERQKTLAFSDAYFDAGQAIVVTKASKLRTRHELSGLLVGVQLGTTGEEAAKNQLHSQGIKPYPDIAPAFDELSGGRIGAVVVDLPVALNELKQRKDLKIIGGTLTAERYGIVASPRQKTLIQQFNAQLAKMKADGRYSKLYAKWFGL